MDPSNRDIERALEEADAERNREIDRIRSQLPGEPYTGNCQAGCGEPVYPKERARAGYRICIDCAAKKDRTGLLYSH